MAYALNYKDIMQCWKRTPEQAANDLERYMLTGEAPDPGCLALAITTLRSELEPVQHAHWELFHHIVTENGMKSYQNDFRCSKCKKAVFHNGEMRRIYKRCYNCGAIMDEEAGTDE